MAQRPHQRKLDRALGWGLSIGAHLALLLAILSAPVPAPPPEPEAIQVSLFEGPPAPVVAPPKPPGPPDEPAPKAQPTPPKPVPPKPPPPIKLAARPVKAPLAVKTIPVKEEAEEADPAPAPPAQPSDAQMAGALTAGAGAGGGGGGGGGGGTRCDMVRRIQLKLREDAMVQAAFASAHRRFAMGSKVIWLWNGDWVRSPGEDGKGLSVVRQAVIWEVGFAPEACRREPVHGLVLISLNDQPGAPRLAIGQGSWRWPDLLFPRRGG